MIECTKQILAMLREGDFAHPGEIEAIERTLSPITKNSEARILDVGCGLGGTAHHVQHNLLLQNLTRVAIVNNIF